MANETAHFLAMKSLSGAGIVRRAARHNLREIQSELGANGRIDATRSGDNSILDGPATSDEVAALANKLMAEAGATPKRKNAVRAIEILFSLPRESRIDTGSYFADALQWAHDTFGLPVLSAVIHRDEAAPHMHVILLPLVDGQLAGSKVMGKRDRVRALQTDFFEQVAKVHGLRRPKTAKHLSHQIRWKSAEMAFDAIARDSNELLRPDVRQAILDAFARNPEPLLNALGLPFPTVAKQGMSFVEIMTKPCKPEPRQSKPIGFEQQPLKEDKSYVSVGFAPGTSSISPPDADEFIRIRDDEVPARYWDADRGEFRAPPTVNFTSAAPASNCEV